MVRVAAGTVQRPASSRGHGIGRRGCGGPSRQVPSSGACLRVPGTRLALAGDKAHLAAQGATLPVYVDREFEDYLKCGRLEHGFLRVRCDSCHAVHDSYAHRDPNCIFCRPDVVDGRIVAENELAFAMRDGFPVTKGHTLVIPKRHVADYFDLHQAERNAIERLLHEQREALSAEDPTITGWNIGVNAGHSAGQTVFHVHVHLMPRRDGDTEEPRGGVRGVIPGKRAY